MTDLSANILPPCKDSSPLLPPIWFCFSHVVPFDRSALFLPCTSKREKGRIVQHFSSSFILYWEIFFVFGLIIILENVCI